MENVFINFKIIINKQNVKLSKRLGIKSITMKTKIPKPYKRYILQKMKSKRGWWEAINEFTNSSSYQAHSKKELKKLIDIFG